MLIAIKRRRIVIYDSWKYEKPRDMFSFKDESIAYLRTVLLSYRSMDLPPTESGNFVELQD